MADRDRVLGVGPLAMPTVAVARAGGLGVLDLFGDPAALAEVARRWSGPFGVRVSAGCAVRPGLLPAAVGTIVADAPALAAAKPYAGTGRRLLVEVVDAAEAQVAVRLGAAGLIARGREAGGRTGTLTTAALVRILLGDPEITVPLWATGDRPPGGGVRGVVLASDQAVALLSPLTAGPRVTRTPPPLPAVPRPPAAPPPPAAEPPASAPAAECRHDARSLLRALTSLAEDPAESRAFAGLEPAGERERAVLDYLRTTRELAAAQRDVLLGYLRGSAVPAPRQTAPEPARERPAPPPAARPQPPAAPHLPRHAVPDTAPEPPTRPPGDDRAAPSAGEQPPTARDTRPRAADGGTTWAPASGERQLSAGTGSVSRPPGADLAGASEPEARPAANAGGPFTSDARPPEGDPSRAFGSGARPSDGETAGALGPETRPQDAGTCEAADSTTRRPVGGVAGAYEAEARPRVADVATVLGREARRRAGAFGPGERRGGDAGVVSRSGVRAEGAESVALRELRARACDGDPAVAFAGQARPSGESAKGVRGAGEDGGVAGEARVGSGPVAPRRHVVRIEAVAPVAGPMPEPGVFAGRRFVVVDDGCGIALELADLLERHGAEVATPVEPAGPADGLVHLGALRPGGGTILPGAYAGVREALVGGARTVLLATDGGGCFGHRPAEGGAGAAGAGLRGLARTLAAEYPDVLVRAVDLDTKESPRLLAHRLLAELLTREGPAEVGYDGDARRGLSVVPAPAPPADARLELTAESVVLLTGGARGITARVAHALAEAYGCHLVLLGRTVLPELPEDAPLAAATTEAELRRVLGGRGRTEGQVEAEVRRVRAEREVRATLERLGGPAASVRYLAADVRDASAVRSIVQEVYSRHGRLDGVVHGAGQRRDHPVAAKEPQEFGRVYRTKVEGAGALAAAVRPDLGFFAVLCGRGTGADTAASGDACGTLARVWRTRLRGRILVAEWGPWPGGPDPVGVPQDPDAAVRALLAELAAGEDVQVVFR